MMKMLQEVIDASEKHEQEQAEATQVQQQKNNAMTADTAQLEIMKLLKQMKEGGKTRRNSNINSDCKSSEGGNSAISEGAKGAKNLPSTKKTLQEHSTKGKNQQYQQIKDHKYNLRSSKTSSFHQNRDRLKTGPNRFKHLVLQQLTAEHVFTFKAYHIFCPDGKKETIDTVLN